MEADIVIEPFDLRNSEHEVYKAAAEFFNQIRLERLPEDPPIPLDEQINSWRNIPPFVQIEAWGARRRSDGKVVAGGTVDFLLTEQNKYNVFFGVDVLPDYRRQGIGTQLLQKIVGVPLREGRRLMFFSTDERVPEGVLCAEKLGARKGLESHTNQLRISELNRELVYTWLAQGPERAPEFEVGFWEGAYPEADIHQVVKLYEVMNSMPHDDLEVEDWHFTPEQIREMEKGSLARGVTRWAVYVREKSSGDMVGFSDVTWHPNRPAILNQANTGVFPAYRNRGLGRWLKAAMLDKVLREKPQVEVIRTGNADSNAPMLKINFELGFKPYASNTTWQVETEKVMEYVEGKEQSQSTMT